jgi:hypothetical protein
MAQIAAPLRGTTSKSRWGRRDGVKSKLPKLLKYILLQVLSETLTVVLILLQKARPRLQLLNHLLIKLKGQLVDERIVKYGKHKDTFLQVVEVQ